MSRHAVAVSPHPGDAVLSCGATLAGLAAGGWAVTLVTVFAGEDAEDRAAAAALGLGDVVQLGLAGAERRGYESPVRRAREDDTAAALTAAALEPVLATHQPDRIFAPLGIGGHVDHLAVVEALEWLAHPAPVVRWRDTPEALHEGASVPLPGETGIPIGAQLARKLDACARYASVLRSWSGGEEGMRGALTAFHEAEGRRLRAGGPAEALVEPPLDARRERVKRREREREDRAALAKLRAQIARS